MVSVVRRLSVLGRPLWCLVLVPVLPLLWVVQRHWVDVPYGDQWELPVDFRQIHDEGVDVSELWRQHNEHRILFPRLAMIALAWPTKWDSRIEMALSLLLALGTLALVCLLLRRTFAGWPRPAVVGIATVTAAVLFSPMQYENWLWGFQISWFMNVLGVVAATAVLTLWPASRPGLEPVLVAAACAVFAQYSLANGTAVWVCLAPLLLLGGRDRRLALVWGAVAAVSTAAYFAGYVKPAGHPPTTEILHHPVEGARYACLLLGRTVFENHDVGIAFGALLVVCFTALCLRIGLRRRDLGLVAAPWICIAIYVLCSALSAAVGRAGFGIEQAASSRYSTISLLFLLATLVLGTLVLAPRADGAAERARPRVIAAAAPWVVVLGMFAADYPDQTSRMADLEASREGNRRCMLHATSAKAPCLRRLYPAPEVVYPRIEFLRELGWLPELPPRS